jgi:hypothetical protein
VVAFFALVMPLAALAAPTPCTHTWQSPLKLGSRGADVVALQHQFGIEATGYYGRLTTAAVSAFQASHGFEQTGALGPRTRKALNAECANKAGAASGSVLGIATTSAPVAPPLTIAPAAQPAFTLAPAGALYVPFTTFTLIAGDADVDVTKLVATRVGPGQDQAFDYVSLLDENGDEVTYGYLQADHTVTFRDSFTVPAHTTQLFTVSGNMKSDLTDYDGQRAGFDVTALTATVPLSGALPIHGTYQPMNESLPIGSATLIRSPQDPASETTRVFGETLVTFAGVRVTAGSSEDLRLSGMTWRQSGSAGTADLRDVQICADDACVPATEDARDYSVSFSPAILIPKGTSRDITVRGRLLAGASNRTVEFDITYSTDIVLRGTTYGFGIAPSPDGNTDVSGSHSAFLTNDGTTDGNALTPFYAGSVANVTSGTAVYIGL